MYSVLILCGEPSGDILGAAIMDALPDFDFYGIPGPLMRARGCGGLFVMEDLCVMGLWELIPKLPQFLYMLYQMVRFARRMRPDLIITIDNKGFNFRFVSYVRRYLSVPCIHVVAPSVWAVKTPEKRLKTLGKLYDHLLCLWSFEPPYFQSYLPVTCIGHPLLSAKPDPYPSNTRQQIAILPGSRKQEIKKHLALFLAAAHRFNPAYTPVILTLPQYKSWIEKLAPGVQVTTDMSELRQSRIALVSSGSVTLDMMRLGIPCVVAYKVSWLTKLWIRGKLITPFVSLINILGGRKIVPECLQPSCEELANALQEVLENRTSIRKAYQEVLSSHRNPTTMVTIAKAVLGVLSRKPYEKMG